MTTSSDGKPPKRRLITGRTSRGWVVFTANTGGVLFIGNGIYVSVAMSFAGHPASGIDGWSVIGMAFCFSLAGIIASPRASNAILRLFERATHVASSPAGQVVTPPPVNPGKWPEVKSRDVDDSRGQGS